MKRRLTKTFGAICGVMVATAVAVTSPAAMAKASCDIAIGTVDTSQFPTIRFSYTNCDNSSPTFTIEENGTAVTDYTTHSGAIGQDEPDPKNEILLLIDASQSMKGEKFSSAKIAAKTLLKQAGTTDKIGLVTFGGTVDVAIRPTTDLDKVAQAVDDITLTQGTRLFDSVHTASSKFGDSATRKMIVLLTDGSDLGSKMTLKSSIDDIADNDVEVFPVGLAGGDYDGAALAALAKASNTSVVTVSKPSQLAAVYSTLGQKLLRSYWADYRSNESGGERVKVTITPEGSQPTVNSYTAAKIKSKNGEVTIPPLKEATKTNPIIGLPGNSFGAIMSALPFGAIILMFAYSWVNARSNPNLEKRIEPFTKRISVVQQASADQRSARTALAPLFLMTESILGKSNMFKKFRFLIEQANLPLREVELLYMMIAGLFGGLFIGFVTGRSIVMLVVFAAIGYYFPYKWVKRKAKKRKKKFEDQLADVLGTIAASLKAGHSFNQSLNAVIKETPNPTAEEFNRVMTEARLGMPLEDALQGMAERMGSEDFDFAVTTVNIQRTVGGSLSEILAMVGDTVRGRQQFRKKVKALTSMGSMSAYVLLGMPIFMMGVLSLLNRTYMAPLFQTQIGHVLLGIGAFFMFLGWAACMKIVAIKT